MSYFFDVFGPLSISRDTHGHVKRSKQEMWNDANEWDEELSTTIGCYMFCIKNGQNSMPWYVGMTVCQQGFYGEVFADHKIELYNSISQRRGIREMYLFPLMTGDSGDSKRFSRARVAKRPVIQWLEKTLMGIALQRNPELLNLKDLTLPRSVTVRGVIGEKLQGRPLSEVASVRQALFGN